MAQEDLEKYFQAKKRTAILHQKIGVILNEMSDEEFHEFWSIKNKVQALFVSSCDELKALEKYSLCAHTNIRKGVADGYDSHHDYFKDVCEDCGKTMRKY
jgi:UDP-N-acetylmuramyl tripeptide synthase